MSCHIGVGAQALFPVVDRLNLFRIWAYAVCTDYSSSSEIVLAARMQI